MKKSIYVIMALMLLAFVACNRMRPRAYHHEQMEQVRIPVDTAQKNDIKETTENEDWEDEPVLEMPDIPGEAGGHPDASGADRMFREGY
jgi:hypothetical protein